MGSIATQDRNARRRKKRVMEKTLSNTTPALPSAQYMPTLSKTPTLSSKIVNAHPIIPPSISANLHNKNKRKGFKQAMEGVSAQRIVFGDTEPNTAASVGVSYRITPPSEQSNLPSNIIVTSVDVEAGYWPEQKDKRPKEYSRGEEVEVDQSIYEEKENESALSHVPFDEIEKKFEGLAGIQVDSIYLPNQLFAYKVGTR